MAQYTISGVCYNKYETSLAASIKKAIDDWDNKSITFNNNWYIADDDNPDMEKFRRVQGKVREWTMERFKDSDVIIYIAPVVRVVRYIGRLLEDQAKDPAVLAVDSSGKYCIPVLSGRRGEAYEIARILDSKLGIRFLNVTTPDDATQFDIARYAEDNDFIISNSDYATEVSTAIHAGDEVGFYTNYPVVGNLPPGMVWKDEGELGVYISPSYNSAFFSHTLWLIPKCITIGIRCLEDVPYRQVEKFILDAMKDYCLYPEAIREIAMVDNSASVNEIRRFAMQYEADFYTVSPELAKNYVEAAEKEREYNEVDAEKCGGGKVFVKAVEDEHMNCSIAMRNVYVRF